MALTFNTNLDAIFTANRLTKSQEQLSLNIGRLSSGLRIFRAADDPAGLAIGKKLEADLRSYGQAQRNANDALSLVQLADGSAEEIGDILSRMRELAVQSANGTLGQSERDNLNTEYQALVAEVDRISNVTEFNGVFLANSAAAFTFQIGIQNVAANNQITYSTTNLVASALGRTSVAGSAIASTTVASATQALTTIASLDLAIGQVATARAKNGASQSRLTASLDFLATTRENVAAAASRILDVDVANETAQFTRNQILVQAGVSLLAQANVLPAVGLNLIQRV